MAMGNILVFARLLESGVYKVYRSINFHLGIEDGFTQDHLTDKKKGRRLWSGYPSIIDIFPTSPDLALLDVVFLYRQGYCMVDSRRGHFTSICRITPGAGG